MATLDSTLDWSQCSAVERHPDKVSGAWVFRDTRLPVATVIENLEDLSIEEVMEQFDVTREQITAVLDFVAKSLRAPEQAAAAFSDKFAVEWIGQREDYGEERSVLLGMTSGQLLYVAYTERGENIRIISARRATRHEQDIYFRQNAE